MPNRLQKGTYDHVYRWIKARDGEHCIICRRGPNKVKLEIDHADNNPDNWTPGNLHFMCKTDNLKMRNLTRAEHVRVVNRHSATNEREREREIGLSNTTAIRQVIDYEAGSIEMQANSRYEATFREWVIKIVNGQGGIDKKECLNGGAELVGCSPLTASRYLAKLTSTTGPLTEARDEYNRVFIILKNER